VGEGMAKFPDEAHYLKIPEGNFEPIQKFGSSGSFVSFFEKTVRVDRSVLKF
jgi:hypothetical protein